MTTYRLSQASLVVMAATFWGSGLFELDAWTWLCHCTFHVAMALIACRTLAGRGLPLYLMFVGMLTFLWEYVEWVFWGEPVVSEFDTMMDVIANYSGASLGWVWGLRK